MRYYIKLLCLVGLFLLLINSSQAEPQRSPDRSVGAAPPAAKESDSQVKISPVGVENELKRLKEALNEKDLTTKLWALRRLAKHPAYVSGPILLEQFNRLLTEDTLAMRCVIVYCFGQMEYQPAIPQLVQALKMDLSKYGWTPPEVFQEDLAEQRRMANVKKDKAGDSSIPSDTPANRRERIINARQQMLVNYNQKLNWGLLHIRIMQIMGKSKVKEASDELYRLITAKEIPIAYLSIDTLKLINDPKIIETLTNNSIIYWQPHLRERVIYTMTELSCPYRKAEDYESTEWLKKSLFKLVAEEVNKPGQSNICLIKALNIMDMLSKPNCQIYDFSSENNLMKEFTDLTNLLKANDPEIMLYDHDLLIKFIRDEMLMKALYNIFSDVLKPPVPIIIQTPSSTLPPETAPKTEPSAPEDKEKQK